MPDPAPEHVYEGCINIRNLVEEQAAKPFFVGRNGTIETEALYFWLVYRRGSAAVNPTPYPWHILRTMECNAGVFPATDTSLDAWAEEYVEALKQINGIAAGWYEPVRKIETALLDMFTPEDSFRFPLRSLEPFYSRSEFQWSRKLSGKRVTVVSSFSKTIEQQIARGVAPLWTGENEGLLPKDVHWSFSQTGYAPVLARGSAEWPKSPLKWQDAIGPLTQRILNAKPDIVLIGCGGLGMVLAGRLRAQGVSCIVLGGAIQVLFGIKGNRWSSHPVISKLWNDAWVWPSASETPAGAAFVERACYWGSLPLAQQVQRPQKVQRPQQVLPPTNNEDPDCERSSPGDPSKPNL